MRKPEIPHQPRIRLSEARNERRLSQQALADAIQTTYVNVSRWERGITKPSPFFRRKLCQIFGKTEAELDLLPQPASDKITVPTPAEPDKAPQPATPQPLYDPAIPLKPAIGLVGRERELVLIREKLCTIDNVAITALNGLPGVGKTTLSITLAHDPLLRAHFHDGILWAGLGPNPNLPGLLSHWGHLLGISSAQMGTLTDNKAWANAIRTAIGSRSMLLVIDDAWTLEEALTFKVGGPNCSHLVTTRFPFIASHMAITNTILIHELSKEASMELLEMLAPQVVSKEAQKALTLVQAVGGLPLALTLIGNYLRKQSYSGQARRITAALERLTHAEVLLNIEEPNVAAETHTSLPAETSLSLKSIISVTDATLSAVTRRTLYALSVFPPKPSTFSEDAALVVAACSIDDLDALSDAGLLEYSGDDRYTLHQIIADYAQIHLNDPAPHERLLAYVTDYVEAHKKDYEMLEQESTIILAALDAAQQQHKEPELVEIVCAFAPFLLSRGQYPQAEQYLQQARVAASAQSNHHGTTTTLLYLSEATQMQGNFAQAELYLQSGLTLAQQIEDNESICNLLTNLGWLSFKRGEFTQAEAYLQEGLVLARQIGNQERISGILKNLGSVFGSRGDFAQSEVHLQEGLTIARQMGNREQICIFLINLGTTVGAQGKHQQAAIYFKEGLELARQMGHREKTCVLLINLGEAVAEQEDHVQAEKYFKEGLELAQQIGHREWISALLNNLGLMTRKQGRYQQAEVYLQESLVLARQIGRAQMTAHVLYENGIIHLYQHRTEAADTCFKEMWDVMPSGSQELSALANYGQARVAEIRGQKQEARKLGIESITILETIGHRAKIEVRHWLDQVKE